METSLRKVLGLVLVLILVLSATPFAQDNQDAVILTTQSYWRAFYTLKTPLIRKGDALEEMKGKYDTPLPPKDWQNPDFDDRTWHHSRGGFFPGKFPCVRWSGSSTALALLCLRGKFKVTNPSRVKGLTLTADFGGGIIVYLNGKEVTRSHLSDISQKGMLATADDYPLEAFLDEEGAPLKVITYDKKKREKMADRLRKRKRQIENISIPSSLLRKGVNVLALEVHRSAYPSEYIEKLRKVKESRGLVNLIWSTCALTSIRFSAVSVQGLEPNILFRPQGFQVWNSDLLYPNGILDHGNPAESLEPITIVGTRNGTFSGKVVLGSTDPIKGLKATVSNLKQPKGGGEISSSNIEIRYAMRVGAQNAYQLTASDFDPLVEQAPDEIPVHRKFRYSKNPVSGAVVPIWLTVKVPADAQPGDYEGGLTIKAEGLKEVNVPVNLKVCPFKLPDPQDFHTFTELIPSPESVALYYEVPLWSDKHFKLMEKTYQWLGKIGNRTVYIPLIAQTNLGNAETMVRWIKKENGTYTYDFTIMNRYLDLVEKHQGKPKIVILYVWDVFLEGGGNRRLGDSDGKAMRAARAATEGHGPQVSLLDLETGKVSYEQLPQYTSKEDSLKIWRPLIIELRQNLKKQGLEKRVMLGMVMDLAPAREVVSFFRELLPEAPWVVHCHSRKRNLHGQPYGYQALVWSPKFIKWPELNSKMGWKRKDLIVQFQRGGLSPLALRMIAEMNITGKQRGFGRMTADFWPVLEDKKGKKRGISARYLKSDWGWLNLSGKGRMAPLLAPGAEGAVATVRFEMIREGVQECEARIVLERALADGKITGDLAERCQEIPNQRAQAMHLAVMKHQHAGLVRFSDVDWGFRLGECWFRCSDWQKRSEELFEVAAEVAKKVGGKN